jgi:hypothetical protein
MLVAVRAVADQQAETILQIIRTGLYRLVLEQTRAPGVAVETTLKHKVVAVQELL